MAIYVFHNTEWGHGGVTRAQGRGHNRDRGNWFSSTLPSLSRIQQTPTGTPYWALKTKLRHSADLHQIHGLLKIYTVQCAKSFKRESTGYYESSEATLTKDSSKKPPRLKKKKFTLPSNRTINPRKRHLMYFNTFYTNIQKSEYEFSLRDGILRVSFKFSALYFSAFSKLSMVLFL